MTMTTPQSALAVRKYQKTNSPYGHKLAFLIFYKHRYDAVFLTRGLKF